MYSSISSRMIFSSVWSTLMTSSMPRRMSLANRSWISVWSTACPSSENLGAVVVLGVQHTHEAKAGCTVQLARIQKDRGNTDLSHQLFQQSGGPVHREQRPGPHDEDHIGLRAAAGGHGLED